MSTGSPAKRRSCPQCGCKFRFSAPQSPWHKSANHRDSCFPQTRGLLIEFQRRHHNCRKLETVPGDGNQNDNRPQNINLFWLVDPLDGTKEFIKKNGEFTVNIALVKNKKPIYGIIFKPVTRELYYTENKFSYYTKLNQNYNLTKKIKIKTKKRKIKILVLSRSHTRNNDLILKKFNANKIIQTGSSIKLCLIANGTANIYPRLGTTMEWDIAAGDAILRKAGGRIKTLDGKILKYGKKKF